MGKEMCDSCDKGFITRVTEPSLVLWSQQLNLDPFYSWLCPQLFGGLNVQMLYLGFNPFWVTLCIWLEENSPRLHGYSAVLYLLKGILMDFWYPCWLLFINFGVVKSSLRQAWGTWCSLVWAACTEDHVFNSHGGRNAVKIHVWWVMTHLWVWQSRCFITHRWHSETHHCLLLQRGQLVLFSAATVWDSSVCCLQFCST